MYEYKQTDDTNGVTCWAFQQKSVILSKYSHNTTDDRAADYSQSKEIPALNLWVISIRISLCVSMALLQLLYF